MINKYMASLHPGYSNDKDMYFIKIKDDEDEFGTIYFSEKRFIEVIKSMTDVISKVNEKKFGR